MFQAGMDHGRMALRCVNFKVWHTAVWLVVLCVLHQFLENFNVTLDQVCISM